MKTKFYVTTPIYYVNDNPHIGHAYTTILADVLSRYHRTAGCDVFFLTGLDEHGQKVQQAAERRGFSPQDHCNDLAPRFMQLWDKLEIRYDDFIRTTQPRHVKVVQDALLKVYKKGDIYQSEYEGWYSVAEERFITQNEKESGQFRDVRNLKERNWFFRMSQYQQRLMDHIEQHPAFIQPAHRRNEILGFLKQPLGDLCISRPKSRMSWGVELPFDKDYVTYVWFDALLNYITGVGFGSDQEKFQKWWPVSVHLIGKDILTTHCVYWPTMLFSLELPLPQSIFAHGWWLTGDAKMSKSLGNIVDPLDLVDQYGVDPVRYYLMREMVLGQDANFTLESFIKRYNSDLANDFGNLLNRVSGLIGKYFNKCIPQASTLTQAEDDIQQAAGPLVAHIQELISGMHMNEAIEEILQFVRKVNRYLEHAAPWKVAKDDLARAGTILYTATEALRISTILLSSVMPRKCETVLDILGAQDSLPRWGDLKSGTELKTHDALFPRLETQRK
ncbi:MAG: methionine--tRNA ligase [Candidatus Omnitrophota bacterium]